MVNVIGWSVLIMSIVRISCQIETQVEKAEVSIEDATSMADEAEDLNDSITMVEEPIIPIIIKTIIRENNNISSHRDRSHSRDMVEPPI